MIALLGRGPLASGPRLIASPCLVILATALSRPSDVSPDAVNATARASLLCGRLRGRSHAGPIVAFGAIEADTRGSGDRYGNSVWRPAAYKD